ncbi:MAG: RdgB/HAM1 family non-canonical purine NTP pyrophosphatase [Trueperaceae bacterium]|nr:RdgB/HAM1 family non-canonical purine NTP pyrophosphatase [Trueperaceae bacterium]
MKLVIATGNQGKVREFTAALAPLGFELVSARDAGIEAFPEETGKTYEENARIKALHVANSSGQLSLADDSGLEVDALQGAPGLYSARYGELASDKERTLHLLSNLTDVEMGKRQARFVCSLVLAKPDSQNRSFWGEAPGELLMAPQGTEGFGYDPIFFSPVLGKTFAEATEAEKRKVSHRGNALRNLTEWLSTAEAKSFLHN